MMDNLTGHSNSVPGTNDFDAAKPSSNPSAENRSEALKERIAAQALTTNEYLKLIEEKQSDPFQKRAKSLAASLPKRKLSLFGQLKRSVRKLRGQDLIEILRVEPVCHLDEELFWGGHIDFPKERETHINPTLYVAGWVIGKAARVTAVRITIDNQETIAEVPLSWARPDVMKAYCFMPGQLGENIAVCGFKAMVSIKQFPDEGSLRLQAVFKDGRLAPMGYVKFRKD